MTPLISQNPINDYILLLICSCQKETLYKFWAVINISNNFYSLLNGHETSMACWIGFTIIWTNVDSLIINDLILSNVKYTPMLSLDHHPAFQPFLQSF